MGETFIKRININRLRKLENLDIEISETERKHLIVTGKNGSGKTTLLLELKKYLSNDGAGRMPGQFPTYLSIKNSFAKGENFDPSAILVNYQSLAVEFANEAGLDRSFLGNDLLFAFFPAQRGFHAQQATAIERIELQSHAPIDQRVSDQLLKYLVFLRSVLTNASYDNRHDEVERLQTWFANFENVLKRLFDDKALKLEYDSHNLTFYLLERGKDKVDFNSLSDGYAAVLRIVTELMLRMENKSSRIYDVQGIALIDEIETHLHIELQKAVLPFLTTFFPRIQFIVTTHSPFILNSIENAVVYDLENKIRIKEPFEISSLALVKNYFMVDSDYSKSIENKVSEFEKLTEAETPTEAQENRLADLLMDLSTLSPTLSPEMYLRFKTAEEKIKEKQA